MQTPDKVDIKEINELLEKYAAGKCTATETAILEEWYNSFDSGKASPFEDEAGKQQIREDILNAIHSGIKKNIIETYGLSEKKRTKIISFSPFVKVAAAVAAIILLGGYYLFSWKGGSQVEYIMAEAMPGRTVRLVLPDSSVVWLNAGSSVKYPQSFEGDKREVYMENGEAFFEVAKDSRKPFIVHAGGLRAQVLGTSFDVKSYQQLSDVRITVATGAVQVLNASNSLGVFTQDQQLDYNKQTGRYVKNTVDAGEAAEWKEGMVVLKRVSFDELAVALENQYGVKFKYNGFNSDDYQYTISFNTSLSLPEVLDIIKSIHKMNYKIENNEVIISAN